MREFNNNLIVIQMKNFIDNEEDNCIKNRYKFKDHLMVALFNEILTNISTLFMIHISIFTSMTEIIYKISFSQTLHH